MASQENEQVPVATEPSDDKVNVAEEQTVESKEHKAETKFAIATDLDEKIHLITRNLEEVMGNGVAQMRKLLEERDMKVYWGTATTGKPHIAYFVPMSKIADFLRAGCEVTILFANLHAYLDNMKAPWELLELRTQYYQEVIRAMLEAIGVPLDKLKFVKGTDYQLSKEYTLDVYKLSSLVSEAKAKKAGADVVKKSESPALSGLLYPLLQALDEQYLDVDAQFGGLDQRKIFTFATEQLHRIGYKKRIHLMNPMVPGLTGDKMSSSDVNSKIDILDTPKQIKKKIGGAFCEEGNVTVNGVLSFAKMVIFPLLKEGEAFTIEREEQHGGTVSYNSYDELEQAFAEMKLYPLDLKNGVAAFLNQLLQPIREKFSSKAMKKLTAKAYPVEKKKGSKKNGPKGIEVLDIRVGQVKTVRVHEEDDHLLVMEIQVHNNEVRNVVSGIAHEYPVEVMQGRKVVIVTNTKPGNFKGCVSNGMCLAACKEAKDDDSKQVLELLTPDDSCEVGERVTFEGFVKATDDAAPRASPAQLRGKVKKMKVNDSCEAVWDNVVFTTSAGPITTQPAMANADIK